MVTTLRENTRVHNFAYCTLKLKQFLTGILRNSVKSVLLFLQHDHPFRASWNTGTPGWYVQLSEMQKKKKNQQCFHFRLG